MSLVNWLLGLFVGELFSVGISFLIPDLKKRLHFLVSMNILIALFAGSLYIIDVFDLLGIMDNPLSEEQGTEWQAVFYNNQTLTGPPAFTGKIQGAINGLHIEWGIDAPNYHINENYFSAEFNSLQYFESGEYCFVVEVDDGAILAIDGMEILNLWFGYTPNAVYRESVELSSGVHQINFKYFEENENAMLHLSWYSNPGTECISVGNPNFPP